MPFVDENNNCDSDTPELLFYLFDESKLPYEWYYVTKR